jgi:phage N-6-adenine-methyltransferase
MTERMDFVTGLRPKRVTKFGSTRPVGRPRKYRTNAARQRAYRKRLKQSKRLVYWRRTTDLWETPRDVYEGLHAEFGFTLDVCAIASNAKCDRYFSPEQDGLAQDWGQHICFANPPYGLILRRWVQKAYEASTAGATVVMLVPARVDTRWWHTYVMPYAEIRYIQGRLRFGVAPQSTVVTNPTAPRGVATPARDARAAWEVSTGAAALETRATRGWSNNDR